MTSLSFQPKLSLYPKSSVLIFQSPKGPKRVSFPKKTKVLCSASEQPKEQEEGPQQSTYKKKKKKKSDSDGQKGIDPVGFLTKRGINHKEFAQFLRERYRKACLFFVGLFGRWESLGKRVWSFWEAKNFNF